jgi:hypothetical protein
MVAQAVIIANNIFKKSIGKPGEEHRTVDLVFTFIQPE